MTEKKGKLPTVIICCANASSLTPVVDSPVSNDYQWPVTAAR